MKILELFAGTRSIGKAFEEKGHKVFSVEWNKDFKNINLYTDIGKLTVQEILNQFGKPDVIWASPDCTTYSIAAISKHRRKDENGNLSPVSEYAKFCDNVNSHVIDLIKELNPKYYFIENPRGGMRKMNFIQDLPRYTVTYCKYGDKRMKPTDIWTNHPNPMFLPPSKNGDPDHEAAPRGSKTGTQGLKGSIERSKIPKLLCEHIVEICENPKLIIPKEKNMEIDNKILLREIKDLVKLQKCYSLKKFSHDEKLYFDKVNMCFLMTNHEYAMIVETTEEIAANFTDDFSIVEISRSSLNVTKCKEDDLPDLYTVEDGLGELYDEDMKLILPKGEDEGVRVGVFLNLFTEAPLNTRYLMAFPHGKYTVSSNEDYSKLVFECSHKMGKVKIMLAPIILGNKK